MRSPLAEFLDQLQHEADKENVIVQARHIDLLEYLHETSMPTVQAFAEYKQFLKRWNALTDNGRNTAACN